MKSVRFEGSLFEGCHFEDIRSTDTVFENCTIRSTLFSDTGRFSWSRRGAITENKSDAGLMVQRVQSKSLLAAAFHHFQAPLKTRYFKQVFAVLTLNIKNHTMVHYLTS